MPSAGTISVMIKPASASCNLRCRYCFYADVSEQREVQSYGIMKEETMRELIRRVGEYLAGSGTANISFQGGEPTLAGLPYFRSFVREFENYPDVKVNYSIQTNGTLIDAEWARFFKENGFLVGVSLDGYEKNMNAFRLGADGKGVYYRVIRGIDALRREKVDFNILTVVTRELAKHPKALFDFFKDRRWPYVQLIPCLPAFDEKDDGMSLTPGEYAQFYNTFYDCWEKEARKGNLISVNLFENLAGMMQGYPPYQCGMTGRCTVQYVVESSGDVYPCDFFCLDEYCLGNLKDVSFEDMRNTPQAKAFLASSSCTKQPCSSCSFRNMCNGGCRRQNVCWLTEETCAYRDVLSHILPRMERFL